MDKDYHDELNLKNLIPSDSHNSILDKLIESEQNENLKEDIETLLDSNILTERQAQYIKMYFFEEMTLENIGKEFNITREAVRQGLKKSYSVLKEVIDSWLKQ